MITTITNINPILTEIKHELRELYGDRDQNLQ